MLDRNSACGVRCSESSDLGTRAGRRRPACGADHAAVRRGYGGDHHSRHRAALPLVQQDVDRQGFRQRQFAQARSASSTIFAPPTAAIRSRSTAWWQTACFRRSAPSAARANTSRSKGVQPADHALCRSRPADQGAVHAMADAGRRQMMRRTVSTDIFPVSDHRYHHENHAAGRGAGRDFGTAGRSSARRRMRRRRSKLTNSKVRIAAENNDGGYRVPKDPKYNAARQRLMQRRVLETYSQFLSPLRLPKTLWLFASETECEQDGTTSPHYNPGNHSINMCYQFNAEMEEVADRDCARWPKSRRLSDHRHAPGDHRRRLRGGADARDRPCHLRHSGIPVFGREEDAADQIAAFIAVQFGKDVARKVIKGFAISGWPSGNPPTKPPDPNAPDYPKDKQAQCWQDPFCAFSDEHGTGGQRMYNALCVAYGADPTRSRTRRCGLAAGGARQGLQRRIPAAQVCLRHDRAAFHRPAADEEGPVDEMAEPVTGGTLICASGDACAPPLTPR